MTLPPILEVNTEKMRVLYKVFPTINDYHPEHLKQWPAYCETAAHIFANSAKAMRQKVTFQLFKVGAIMKKRKAMWDVLQLECRTSMKETPVSIDNDEFLSKKQVRTKQKSIRIFKKANARAKHMMYRFKWGQITRAENRCQLEEPIFTSKVQ